MKIAIDARWIFREISGIGHYTRELIRHLALLDRNNEYVLFFDNASVRDRTVAETNMNDAHNFTTQILAYGVFSVRSQALFPLVLTRNSVDVFHSTNYMIPFLAFPRHKRGKMKCVATIHDVIPMIFPDHAPKSRKARFYPLYRRVMLETGARADTIIVDSRTSKTDVIRHLLIPASEEDKVRSVYCGVSERFHPLETDTPRASSGRGAADSGPGSQGNPKKILYVGRTDPYKNLTALIRAFAKARERCPFPVALTVAGFADTRYPAARRVAAQLRIESEVNWTGYLSDDELVSAYRSADLLVHPSRYEGFGLQVVEAMASGLPVICSSAGSLPEVAGDAAVMVDPDDPDGLAEKITEVLTDETLAHRMAEKGLRQADKFTWSRTAAETLEAYKELAQRINR